MSIPVPVPLVLVAEITHRCPLHCIYCSNPLELTERDREIPAESWVRVLAEAAAMGVLEVDFTGGEPLARRDLARLVGAARAAGLYASLITSGVPLDEQRLDELRAAGLDHFQLSFQGAGEDSSSAIAGARKHSHKRRVAEWVKRRGLALTLNFVVHRQNLHELEAMVALTEEIVPERVEFAHVQYYGWAFANRKHLLPTREQLASSLEILNRAQERLSGRTRVEYVVPDYYAKYPKPCMGGWGRKVILVKPDGDVLPCHAANVLPGMTFENVEARPLGEIWQESDSFRRFRGESWMPEPCRSCDRRAQDFGGCRCQAFLLAGDAMATDPVCSLAPGRGIVNRILGEVNRPGSDSSKVAWLYRTNPG
jgi:PqqA peptide cyclase